MQVAETLRIERMSYGDDAIAHNADGKTVLVRGAVTGDVVEAAITESHERYDRATVRTVLEPSPLCEGDFEAERAIAGSPWAYLRYDAQLAEKRDAVANALVRTAKLPAEDVERLVQPTVASPAVWHYRNKIELSAAVDGAGKLHLGSVAPGSADIVEHDESPLAHHAVAKAPKALRGALRFLQQRGDLKLFRVGVRHSERTHSCEVALWCEPSPCNRSMVAKTLSNALPTTSIVRVLATPGSERAVKKVEVLSGDGFWEETLSGGSEPLAFMTSSPSFFQVNTAQAETLVALVIDALGGESNLPRMRVCDLYAGGGTFGLHLTCCGAEVTAVESAGSSVRDLRRNAEANDLDLDIIGGDAAREIAALGRFDALVVDPPRAGLAKQAVDNIAATDVARIAYVSCDPQTLARDIARFASRGYEPTLVTPVDMFPQTYHVECVVVMARAGAKR